MDSCCRRRLLALSLIDLLGKGIRTTCTKEININQAQKKKESPAESCR